MSACSRLRSSTAGTCAAMVALVVLVTMTGACSSGARVTLAASTTSSSTTIAPATTTTASPTTTLAPAPTTVATPATTRAVAGPTTTAAVRTTSAVTTKTAAPLFGAAIGSEAESAVAKLTAALGPPTSDTGWEIGCAHSPTLKNERLVGWDQLRVLFGRDTEAAPGTLRGYGFVLFGDDPRPANSAAGRLALPSGAALGTPIGQVATALGVKAQVDKVFGWVSVTTPGATFTADGDSLSALLNAVSVPRVFSCE